MKVRIVCFLSFLFIFNAVALDQRDPFEAPKRFHQDIKSQPMKPVSGLENNVPQSGFEEKALQAPGGNPKTSVSQVRDVTLRGGDEVGTKKISELETMELSEIKFTGVITVQGVQRIIARIGKKTVYLKPGDKVGKESGIIKAADGQKVTIEVQETTPDNSKGVRKLIYIPMGG